jgi:transcriptional regulator with XRE-family HTH domain
MEIFGVNMKKNKNTNFESTFRDIVRQKVFEQKLRHEDLAQMAGCGRSNISMFLGGKNFLTAVPVIKLANKLNIDILSIIENEDTTTLSDTTNNTETTVKDNNKAETVVANENVRSSILDFFAEE